MHLRPLGHLSNIGGEPRGFATVRLYLVCPISIRDGAAGAERVGFEPTVPLRVRLISNQVPSAARSSLRGGLWRPLWGLSTRLRGVFRRLSGPLADCRGLPIRG